MARVSADLSSLTPRAARAQLEDTIGVRLRGWIMRAEASFTDVAKALGMHRPELYELMEGERAPKLAWLALLPPKVLRAALEDLAAGIGYELRARAVLAPDHDAAHAATVAVHEALDAIRSVTATQADGRIDREEAINELREWDELDEAMAKRRALLRRVIESGAAVYPIASAGSKGSR